MITSLEGGRVMLELLIELLGYSGMALVLLTLALAREHFRKSQIVSIIGGLLLSSYAGIVRAVPVLILNVIWTLMSIYNLWKSGGKHAKRRKP